MKKITLIFFTFSGIYSGFSQKPAETIDSIHVRQHVIANIQPTKKDSSGFKEKPSIRLYPNPANSNFTLTIPESIIGSNIKIYNSLGQLVLEQNIKSAVQNISIQNLANGIYCYFIDNNEKNIFGKLIKN